MYTHTVTCMCVCVCALVELRGQPLVSLSRIHPFCFLRQFLTGLELTKKMRLAGQ